jgi:germination protein M
VDIQNLPTLESARAEQDLICAVVNTLTEFPTIDRVQFKFDGEGIKKLPHGTSVNGPMRTVPLNEEPLPVNASDSDALYPIRLYFANLPASLYVPVARTVTREPTFALAMNELVSGPQDEALRNSFPEGTHVLSAGIVDNVASVNFSSEFNALKENAALEEIALDTIQLTAKQFGAISALHVQVEGRDYQSAAIETLVIPQFANSFRNQ